MNNLLLMVLTVSALLVVGWIVIRGLIRKTKIALIMAAIAGAVLVLSGTIFWQDFLVIIKKGMAFLTG